MDWHNRSLAEMYRLLVALEQAGGQALVQGLIDRVELPPAGVPHGRITIESIVRLLDQTRGSTVLPPALVEQLHAAEPCITVLREVTDRPDYFATVTSVGGTGQEWISSLERQRYLIGGYARQVLSNDHCSTTAVTYHLALIRNTELLEGKLTNAHIWAEAQRRGYRIPPIEVAVLLRQRFVEGQLAQLGLAKVVVMHEPYLWYILGCENSGNFLYAYGGTDDHRWDDSPAIGFVFLLP